MSSRAKREGLATVGYDVLESPLGPLWVAIESKRACMRVLTIRHYGGDCRVEPIRELRRSRPWRPGAQLLDQCRSSAPHELDQYFNGTRREFDVAVDLSGLTPFQTKVLAATAKIPFGAVSTYGAVAKRAGNARASRATGGALNQNPIPIVVPCHRVVGSNGSLVGYAGGLDVKRRLLAIEGADLVGPRRH